MGKIRERLLNYSCVFLDTSVFIYHFEKNGSYFNITKEIFSRLDDKLGFSAVTSIISLLELCVKPIKDSRDDLVEEYSQKLLYDQRLTTWMIDKEVVLKAANLRATYAIKTPDAIQIATSILGETEVFITNDKRLRIVNEIEVLILDDFL
ncbi:MAG: PIN domain-containing protein [bacterium]